MSNKPDGNIMPKHIDITSRNFFQRLINLPFVDTIYLYGSRARGDNIDARVDIDLAISCPQASDGHWHQLLDILQHADTLLKIDCVRLDRLEDMRLKAEIERDGVVLWKK